MSDIFGNMYKKFFLRDVLSIFLCGLIFMLFISFIFKEAITKVFNEMYYIKKICLTKNELNIVAYLLLIGSSYAIGLIINQIRDWLQFKYLYKKKFKETNLRNNIREYNRDYIDFYEKSGIKEQNDEEIERMIMMFQFSGNYSLTLIFCFFTWVLSLIPIIKDITLYIIAGCFIIIAAIFSCIRFCEHIDFLNLIVHPNLNDTNEK